MDKRKRRAIIHWSIHHQWEKNRLKNVSMAQIDNKKKRIWCSPTKLDERLSQNVQNIRRRHKVYRENHGKLESRIDNRRKKVSWGENPEQKKYKTRHDWMGKVIHWESSKKFKFDHTNKWYMHNPESVLENETLKICVGFEIRMDHLISARRPNLVIVDEKKRTCRTVNFALPVDHRVKLKESRKRDKYLDLARELNNCGTWKWRLY